MAYKEILAELTFTSEYSDGVYAYVIAPVLFQFVDGETYRIVWGVDSFVCEGHDGNDLQEGTSVPDGTVMVGDDVFSGAFGNNEPFLLATIGDALTIMCLTDAEPTEHTVAIYQVVEERPKITLYNRAMGEETFETNVLRIPTTDGGIRDFVEGTPVETTVELDFSGGDMTVIPGEGELFKSVQIKQPENLIPGNIPKGERIAGIEGELVSTKQKSRAVDFYDIFGNIIHSYTMAEAIALTELPPGPELDGYDFSEWTYTLDNIHTYPAGLDIGPRYTKNGKFAAIVVVDAVAGVEMPLHFNAYVTGEVTIDWGDGEQETVTISAANTNYSASHTYVTDGVKIIGFLYGFAYRSYFRVGKYSKGALTNGYQLIGSYVDKFTRWLISVSGGCTANVSAFYGDSELVLLDVATTGSSATLTYARLCGKLKAYTYSPIVSGGIRSPATAFLTGFLSLKRYFGLPSAASVTFLDEIAIPGWVDYDIKARRVISYQKTPNAISHSIDTEMLQAIYVPDSAVDDYKANSSWSQYADYIKPLSEYPY